MNAKYIWNSRQNCQAFASTSACFVRNDHNTTSQFEPPSKYTPPYTQITVSLSRCFFSLECMVHSVVVSFSSTLNYNNGHDAATTDCICGAFECEDELPDIIWTGCLLTIYLFHLAPDTRYPSLLPHPSSIFTNVPSNSLTATINRIQLMRKFLCLHP